MHFFPEVKDIILSIKTLLLSIFILNEHLYCANQEHFCRKFSVGWCQDLIKVLASCSGKIFMPQWYLELRNGKVITVILANLSRSYQPWLDVGRLIQILGKIISSWREIRPKFLHRPFCFVFKTVQSFIYRSSNMIGLKIV